MSMSHSVAVLVSGAFARLRLGVGEPLAVLVVTGSNGICGIFQAVSRHQQGFLFLEIVI